MAEQPENIVLALLRELRADIAKNADRMATKGDIAGLDQKVDILRADVASDLAEIEKRLGDRIGLLQRAVMEYHPFSPRCGEKGTTAPHSVALPRRDLRHMLGTSSGPGRSNAARYRAEEETR